MIAVPAGMQVLMAAKPVDFRKGGDGLAALVREALDMILFRGTLFVFRAKRADRVKILAWDGSDWCCCGNVWSMAPSNGRRSWMG